MTNIILCLAVELCIVIDKQVGDEDAYIQDSWPSAFLVLLNFIILLKQKYVSRQLLVFIWMLNSLKWLGIDLINQKVSH